MPVLLKSKTKKTDLSTIIHQKYFLLCLLYIFSNNFLTAQRIPVLSQIDLPHNYYFRELYLPQLTSGPSSVSWSADGKYLIYSMNGSLWKQEIGKETAEQLTDGNGYDYQPDCSPDGKQIIFVRYNGDDIQLMLLDIASRETVSLTNNKAVNLEPRWNPDGKSIVFVSTYNSGHFLLFKARIDKNNLSEIECLIPERKSATKRYYYSPFDHAINPVWSKDGKEIYCVSNREIAHGTGDIICINSGNSDSVRIIRNEETQWNTPSGASMQHSFVCSVLVPTANSFKLP